MEEEVSGLDVAHGEDGTYGKPDWEGKDRIKCSKQLKHSHLSENDNKNQLTRKLNF